MYIIPTIYIKSCHKKRKRKNPQLKLQTQIARENKKEPINPLTPKNLNPPIHHSLLLRSQPIYTIRLLCCLADLTIPFFLFLCFSSWSGVLGCASRLNVLTKNPSMSGWQSLCLGYCCQICWLLVALQLSTSYVVGIYGQNCVTLSMVLVRSQAQDSFSCGDARAFFLILLQPRQKAQQLLEIYLPLFLKSRKPLLEIYLPFWNLNGGMVQLLLGNTCPYCLFHELVVVLDLLDCQGFFFAIFFFFLLANLGFFQITQQKKEGQSFRERKPSVKIECSKLVDTVYS